VVRKEIQEKFITLFGKITPHYMRLCVCVCCIFFY
jgi:hypothetical protein